MPILAPILAARWSQDAVLSVAERLDVSDRLIRFYTRHLPQHPAWGISADINAVTATQQSILSTHLATRSLDTVYREILARFAHTYPDQTLASLIGAKDASGLFHTAVTVPGVFTRAAYDGAIANAIDAAAANSTVPNDWVLGTDAPALAIEGSTAEVRNRVDVANAAKGASFKARLRDRYFGDYANHWQAMMNSLQWEGAPTMPVAIDQAQRLTDPRHSPLNALMRSLAYQGSIGGAAHASLPNIGTIPGIAAASKMLPFPVVDQGNSIDVPHHHAQSLPMLAVFRPIFQLLGQHPAPANANAGVASEYTDASLVRFMDKLTALRLKLQQTSGVPANAADLRTKQTLRALFEGSDPSLADAQSYARWAQASMGSEWAGMADALFVRPIAQLGRQVAQSAQDGINAAWHKTILATWHRSFAGRYPFAPSNNDASIPELVRFIRPDGGLIDNFVRTHLAGMLQREGNQWVPISFAAATPTFDPEFLLALNTLQRIASHLQAHGDLQYRFDLQPVPTPGLTDTILLLDGKRLRYSIHYFNERETWHAFRWPALHPDNPGTRLQWQTINAGTNKNFEFQGRWAWLRMLEMAEVVPIDGAMFKLTWQSIPDVREPDSASTATADDSLASRDALRRAPSALNYPISYLIRTDRGRGPHNLLALRDFVMPSRIFMDTAPTVETESL
jgi:type VI secretion system protein ImpL